MVNTNNNKTIEDKNKDCAQTTRHLLRENKETDSQELYQGNATALSNVIKDNSLVKAVSRFSIQELRFLSFCLACCDQWIEDNQNVIARVDNLLEIFPSMGKKTAYNVIKNTVLSLNKKPLEFKVGEVQHMHVWFTGLTYFEKKGEFCFRLNSEMLPFLIRLKKNFTQYRLGQVGLLKSIHSFKLYELLKSQEYKRKFEISVEEFREVMCIDDRYHRYASLNQWVLKPALEEVNAKTDLFIRMETSISNRKITSLVFHISSKSENIQPATAPPKKARSGISLQEACINTLLGIGIHKKTAQEYVERIEEADKLQIILEKLPGMIERSKGQAQYVLGAIQNEITAKVNYQDRARKYKLALECKERKGTCKRRSLRDKSICEICHQVLS